ncbi:MAG: RQC domain-containing protein, partial [Balneolales bacterium]
NVRYVVHMNLPKNIESYYQETGRAGRDGLQSDALLFYSKRDLAMLKDFARVDDNEEQSKIMLDKLSQMGYLCESKTCRRKFILNYFDEEHGGNCATCDVCLSDYEEIDGTVIAQKALSAIARLKENYGMNHVIDFLKGSKTKKIPDWQREIKTYGVGSDHSREEWSSFFNDLKMKGYLDQNESNYNTLSLTGKSWNILKGKEKIRFLRAVSRRETGNGISYEKVLFDRLREVRSKVAERENTAAFIIFSDATLVELASRLPKSIEELGFIKGFGEAKIERYGQEFLGEVVDYCREFGLESQFKQKQYKQRAKKSAGGRSQTKIESLKLFKEGNSTPEIAGLRGLGVNTIEEHLSWFVGEGELSVEDLVPPQKITPIQDAIKEHGWAALRPLKDALGEDYTYGEIKAVVEVVKSEG